MKFLLFFFVLSLHVEASDCISQAANLSIGLKLRAALQHELYGEDGTRGASVDVCKTNKFKDDWEDSRKYKNKMLKIIKNDLKTKGKTSAEFLHDFDVPDKKEITDADICPMVAKQIKQESNCSADESSLQGISRLNLMDMDFEKACRLMLPKTKEHYENRNNCSYLDEKKDEVVKRDPPGEEIAPADDGAPEVRTHVLKTKSREQVREDRPARVRTSTGSAVNRQ